MAFGFVFLFAVACNRTPNVFAGFKKTKSGAYMKFYTRSESGVSPRLKDRVTFEMSQYFDDSLVFTTVGDEPIDIILEPASFVGDVTDALLMMQIGDSAGLVVLSDSVFVAVMNMETPEEYAGKPIYYDMKLLSIKPFEEIEAENKILADSLKVAEQAYLERLRNDAKNIQTESGLIIMEQTGNGKRARMGDYVDFDFTLCTQNGDTLMNSFGVNPVEIQYGEEFICEGFNEALGLVAEGGMMHFVIPSQLGYDSVGYEGIIKPYTSLVVNMKMNDVMDKEAYDKKIADREAEREAERQRLMAAEKELLENYVKENGIVETPTESGLYIIRKEEGKGELVKWGDNVSVHYTLSNLKGELLESSYDYNQPISFVIGNGEMIPAIEEALMTMAPGAKVTVVTPSEQAFGEYEIDKDLLPAYSPLIIELELVSVE